MKQFDLLDLQFWKSKTLWNLEEQFGKSVDFIKIMYFHDIFCQRNDKLSVPTGELQLSGDPAFLGMKVEL